jgi:hypothetical protein
MQMDFKKTILWAVFSMSGLMLYSNWQVHEGKPSLFGGTPVSAPAPSEKSTTNNKVDLPTQISGAPAIPATSIVASGAIEDYIDNFTAAGLENLDYDEIHPDEDWVTDNVVGSSRTGNNPEWANAVETPNNEKRNKIRKDNLLAKIKRKAYNKSPQPIVTDKSGENAGDKIMTKLESIDEKKKQKINEDYTRILDLMSYKKNTQ